MSQQLPPAGSQAPAEAIVELMNELAFQNVLLSSIDSSVENQVEAEAEVRVEIKALEKQLRALKRGFRSATVDSTPSALQSAETPYPRQSSPGLLPDAAIGDGLRLQSGPYQGREQCHTPTSTSIRAPTPNSANSTAQLSTPSKMHLPTRKRSHSEHLDVRTLYTDIKSRRTSPSPFRMDTTTPSSTSGDDDYLAFDTEIFKQQRDEEKRIQREKADESFARIIQDSAHHRTSRPGTMPGVSAFDRMSGMRPPSLNCSTTMLPSNPPQRGQASPSWGPPPAMHVRGPVKAELQSTGSGIKDDVLGLPGTIFSPYKSSQDRNTLTISSPSRTMPGSFHKDEDDDSDIEIISPSAFKNRGNSFNTGDTALRRVAQTPTNSALQMAMFGKHSIPTWMNGSTSEGSKSTMISPINNFNYPAASEALVSNSNSYADHFNPGKSHYGAGIPGSAASGMPTGYPGYSGYSMQSGIGIDAQKYPGVSRAGHFQAHSMSNGHSPLYSFPPGPTYDNETPGQLYQPPNERLAGQLDYIMNDPRKTDEEIKALIENIRPDEELPAEDREGTPEGLKYALYEHQKLALTWLKSMEESKNKAAILADDMGLGKTLSSIALILSRPSTDRLRKTTLIVGPVALVRQWEKEIRRKVKSEHRLSTHIVHGGRRLSWDELRTYDVVLTTYNTLAAEYKRWEKFLEDQHTAEREIDEGPLRKKFPLLGPKSLFYRVILDEAQCIKNKSTMSAKAAYELKSITRLCLTGTPMMNNVGELYSLIHFLRIRPYNDYSKFQADFGLLTKGNSSQHQSDKAMRKLQALLKAVLLRRTKTSLIDGKPIITLPPKTEEITHLIFSEDEQAFYNALEGTSRVQFNKYMRANTVGRNYSNILVLLLRLRQCCCHPHLITDFEEAPLAGAADLTEDDMTRLAESLTPNVVNRISAAESFECPVCYDAVDNPIIIIPCGHDTCSECLTKISDQENQQNVINGDETGGTSKCPSCRGKLEKNKIIDYATFKRVHMNDPTAALSQDDTRSLDSGSSDDISEFESDSEMEREDDADGNGDLRDFIVPDGLEDNEDVEEKGGSGEDGGDESVRPKKKSKLQSKPKSKKKRGKQREKKPKNHVSIAMLKKEASRSARGRRRYLSYLRRNWQPSAKVNKCVELLERFHDEDQKTIVFSQFVSLLDLLEVPISEKGWACERYDGSMSADARNNAINRFTDNRDIKIMLISMKAGNSGLNLVAASRVIILDPFWNPFVEMQAVDRAYRIGQQRPVEVHRILVQGTIEDRIIELQQRKKRLVEEALSEGASKSLGRLGVRELAFLFGVGGSS